MDVAIAKEVFRLLLEMGRTFRADKKELAKWNNYLQRLPSYQINDEGPWPNGLMKASGRI